MVKTGILAGTLMAVSILSPAAAQSWSVGVGVGIGGPDYYGPPPVYYGAPPPYVYEQPPVVYMPAPGVRSSISPDAVFDTLERSGYRDFSPMAFRDGVYKLNAVNRRGDLVALEVSALDGAVEREYILSAQHSVSRVAPRVRAPSHSEPPASSPAPASPTQDPMVVY
jgi:hypothetical protein